MTERKIVAEYTAKIDGYLAGLAKMKTATGDFGKSLTSSVSKSTADWDTISGASLAAGAALAAGLGVAGKAAIDWESAWAGVNKTVDGTPAQMAALEQGLRNMAKTLPATHQEIAAVARAPRSVHRPSVTVSAKGTAEPRPSPSVAAQRQASIFTPPK